jgi:hypothetical protein
VSCRLREEVQNFRSSDSLKKTAEHSLFVDLTCGEKRGARHCDTELTDANKQHAELRTIMCIIYVTDLAQAGLYTPILNTGRLVARRYPVPAYTDQNGLNASLNTG